MRERAMVSIRMEFTNAFNRTVPNNAGQTTAGFGYVNTSTTLARQAPSRAPAKSVGATLTL